MINWFKGKKMQEQQVYLLIRAEKPQKNCNFYGDTSMTVNIALAAYYEEQGGEVYLYPQMTKVKEFKIQAV